jgi:hypothetical protein
MTMRLDTFLDLYNINEVDYLWIDAQGNDFKVLQSLGSRIASIKEGKCEATFEVALYKEASNHAYDIKQWLESHNFECWFGGIYPVPVQHEVDVHFRRK